MKIQSLLLLTGIGLLCPALSQAHDLIPTNPAARERLRKQIEQAWMQDHPQALPTPDQQLPLEVASQGDTPVDLSKAPAKSKPFQAFLPALQLTWDNDFLYIGSNGLPAHPMMIGITAWQQQVPLPQAYSGDNLWRLPLKPKPAATPAMIKGRFLRGAIALGVNGIPIFNPQNNRGEVSYEIGELDKWGGHCGRADDYHYHIAPLHLQSIVGKDQPVAYALDGYPIYGLTEPDGSPVTGLDECHGHELPGIGYHYHAAMEYPYVIGGFHGEVVELQGQVDPQPRATPVREALPALRGAEITGFEKMGENSYQLSYKVGGDARAVRYSIQPDGTYPFEFDNGREGTTKEVYTARPGGGGDPGRPGGQGKGPGKGGRGMRGGGEEPPPPPPEDEPRPPRPQASQGQGLTDPNGDGIISAQEFAENAKRQFTTGGGSGGSLADAMSKARTKFQTIDTNHNGKLEAPEWQAASPLTTEPSADPEQPRSSDGKFLLSSPKVEEGGELPLDYTGDGRGVTPPLEWKGAPAGTQSYAIVMDHMDREGNKKWYWTQYDLPGNARSLAEDAHDVGKLGTGFKGQIGYEPPRSQGPGAKTYTITIYALSATLQIQQSPGEVDRELLIASMSGKVLASSSLNVVHTNGGAPKNAPPTPPTEPSSGKKPGQDGLIKPSLSDTIKLNVYADNWFMLYVNGRLVAVDPIQFTPHNVVSVDFLPEYPMTIAVLAKDNADPKTGMEYGTNIGDGGLVLKFADGTVTDATWKAKSFFHGPVGGDTANPRVQLEALPENWWAVNFDDSSWANAKEYTVEEVDPKQPYFDNDFESAKFIWTGDLALDNTIVFRKRVEKPGWTPRWNTRPDLDVTGAPTR